MTEEKKDAQVPSTSNAEAGTSTPVSEPGVDNKKEETNTSPLIEKTNEASERLEKATTEMEKERKKIEKVSSDLMLQGKGLMGKPEQAKKELTDEEYADAYTKGEVDPFTDGRK